MISYNEADEALESLLGPIDKPAPATDPRRTVHMPDVKRLLEAIEAVRDGLRCIPSHPDRLGVGPENPCQDPICDVVYEAQDSDLSFMLDNLKHELKEAIVERALGDA